MYMYVNYLTVTSFLSRAKGFNEIPIVLNHISFVYLDSIDCTVRDYLITPIFAMKAENSTLIRYKMCNDSGEFARFCC